MSDKPCEQCDDGDGFCVFPYYGVGPHKHVALTSGPMHQYIGTTHMLPKESWPANYREDPDVPGCGTYTHCLNCGAGEAP